MNGHDMPDTERDMPALPLLVVEDDPAILELLEEELADAGYATLAATSAEQALATLSHSEVALVISDVRLPGIDGMQLLERLRREGSGFHRDHRLRHHRRWRHSSRAPTTS